MTAPMRDRATGGLVRTCPHCGAAARTLGSRCPACDRDLVSRPEDRGFLDRLPLIDTEVFEAGGSSLSSLLGLVVGLGVNGLIVIVAGVPYAVVHGARRLLQVLARRGARP